MALQYFNLDQIIGAARSGLRPRLLTTMGATILGAVVLYGLFGSVGGYSFTSIAMHFIGGVLALLWLLFGLTATAHQIHAMLTGNDIPNPKQAASFAWQRAQSILMLPVWGIGLLVALLLVEMMAIALGKIPGLGLVWLAGIGVPLLLLNTVVAVALLLALFNIAARVAISGDDAATIRDTLWNLLRDRLPELLLYNLGGVLATALIAVIVLSPLWLGLQVTEALFRFEAPEAILAIQSATGFWGGIAHTLGLVMVGALSAAVASVPGIVITHLTLSTHMELDVQPETEAETAVASAATTASETTAAEPAVEPEQTAEKPKAVRKRSPRKPKAAADDKPTPRKRRKKSADDVASGSSGEPSAS